MATISQEYLDSLAPIYGDVMRVFPAMEPSRKLGYGLAVQTIYEYLRDAHSFGEISEACRQLEKGGAVTIKNNVFVHPTDLGEDIIAALVGRHAATIAIPPFSPRHLASVYEWRSNGRFVIGRCAASMSSCRIAGRIVTAWSGRSSRNSNNDELLRGPIGTTIREHTERLRHFEMVC